MRSPPLKVVVVASGRGSNLEALIDAERRGELHVQLVGVLSDRADARALDVARQAGIPTLHVDPRAFASRIAFDLALFARVAALTPDLIVLAGFMRILDPAAFVPWLGRLVNIHPSLLPRYPGLHTHRRAIAAGDRRHGASVHFVTAELDGGPVIAQVEIAINDDDTPQTLAERLLPREHRLMVASVALLASGRAAWNEDGVLLDGQPLAAPLRLSDDGRWTPPTG
jgi:phosphoribosylglycinamide formyltransferase-1